MSIDHTLICDNCSRVIHAAHTSALARSEAREQCGYRRVGPRDLCAACVEEQYPHGLPGQVRAS